VESIRKVVQCRLFVIPACPESFFVFGKIPDLPKAFGIAGMTDSGYFADRRVI